MMPRLETPRRRASTTSAIVAFFPALGLVYLFHQHRGPVAIFMSLFFGLLAAMVAFFTIERITRHRWKQKTPVLGALRGAGAALLTFTITLSAHVCMEHKDGGFWISLLITLAMGLYICGWMVAIVGAMVGTYCERTYFPNLDANARANGSVETRIKKYN
jgi:hypothetical protein